MWPFTAPHLNPDLPIYPVHLQLLKIGGGTVAGPTSDILLYAASTQQLVPATLKPRNREPCFVLDVNGLGLPPGYHLGRLAGSWQELPVYESVCCPPEGLTEDQLNQLASGMYSHYQLHNLYNLNPCQLQVLITALSVTQIGTLTSSMTANQLGNLVDALTVAQLMNMVLNLTTAQLMQLSSALTPYQMNQLVQVLTVQQIQGLTVLSDYQLQQLMTFSPDYIALLVNTLSLSELRVLLNMSRHQLNIVADLDINALQVLLRQNLNYVNALASSSTQRQLGDLLVDITAQELSVLTGVLSVEQLMALGVYLDCCRLEGFVTVLASSAPQTLRGLIASSTPDQFQRIAGYPTGVVNALTTPELLALSNYLHCCEVEHLSSVLTTGQIKMLLASSTPTQLHNLTQYPTPQIRQIVQESNSGHLGTLLNAVPVMGIGTSAGGNLVAGFTGTRPVVTNVVCSNNTLTVYREYQTFINGMLVSIQ